MSTAAASARLHHAIGAVRGQGDRFKCDPFSDCVRRDLCAHESPPFDPHAPLWAGQWHACYSHVYDASPPATSELTDRHLLPPSPVDYQLIEFSNFMQVRLVRKK